MLASLSLEVVSGRLFGVLYEHCSNFNGQHLASWVFLMIFSHWRFK
jgi:hypothetical protein